MDFFQYLRQEGESLSLSAYEHVFHQGEQDRFLYFLSSGLLKAYYVTEGGKEMVKSFIMPDNIIASLSSVYSHEACSFSLVCLQDSQLIRLPFEALFERSRQDQVLANKMIDLLMALAIKKERREYEFLCLSAERRYRLLLQENPHLLEQVTQNDIARYLGVTPVALSRIKQRIK